MTNATMIKWIKRFLQYYVFRTIAKVFNWFIKKIGGSILSIIALVLGAVFLWYLGMNYRIQLIDSINNAIEAWKNLTSGG